MFVPDGADRDHNLAELDGSGNVLRVFVYGPGADEPLVRWDNGANMVHADRLGSIIAVADNGGTVIGTNSYDEYGVPAAANQGRFGYTGQAALPEIGVDYYKNRMYLPGLGRFPQTDPILYAGGSNFYQYAGSNQVNFTDPSGRTFKLPKSCTGTRILSACGPGGIANGLSGFSTAGVVGRPQHRDRMAVISGAAVTSACRAATIPHREETPRATSMYTLGPFFSGFRPRLISSWHRILLQ